MSPIKPGEGRYSNVRKPDENLVAFKLLKRDTWRT